MLSFRQVSTICLASLMVSLSLSLSGCSKTEEKNGTMTGTTYGTAAAGDKSAGSAGTDSAAKSTAKKSSSKIDTASGATGGGADTNDRGILPQIIEAQKLIDLEKMPDSEVICTVAGTPITVGGYRSQLRQQQEQLQAQLSANADLEKRLLDEAKARHVTLTPEEKRKLTETTKRAEKATKGVLNKLMESDYKNPDVFLKHVLDIGLAFKEGTNNIRDQLLQQMVDRELFCAAARTAGFGPRAFNWYVQRRKQKDFPVLEKTSGLSQEQLKDEIMKDELVRLMMEHIEKTAVVDDKSIKEFYDAHKDQFKHGERIRISQIVVAAPKVDMPPEESVRTQLKRTNPKWDDAELEKQVKLFEQQQQMRAQEILDKALKSGDFAALANENTDDPGVRAARNGGDMGYLEKKSLLKEFVDKVWPLKVGETYPKVIESSYGFHIVKVTDKEPPGLTPLSEVKEDLRKIMVAGNQQRVVSDWLVEKRRSQDITLSPEFQSLVKAEKKSKP